MKFISAIARAYKANPALLFFIFLLICIYIYWAGLHGPLIFDDLDSIVPLFSDKITYSNIDDFLFGRPGLNIAARPLAMASFMANVIFSGSSVFPFKLTNLIIHLINGALIFWLSARLGALRIATEFRPDWRFGALVAGLWLIHPLHVSTVLYVVQRMTLLMASFVLLSLLVYVIGRQRQLSGKSGSWHVATAYLVFMPLGVLCKENAALFPIYALLIELLFFNFKVGRDGAEYSSRAIKACVFFPIIAGIFYFLFNFDALVLDGYAGRDFTLYQRLLTEFRVVVYYLYQLMVPMQRNMAFVHDNIAVSSSWTSPFTTFLSFLVLAELAVVAWGFRRRNAGFAFGIFFFFCSQAMESTIIPLELMFEHRNYIPAFGIVFACMSVLYRIKNVPRTVTAGVIIALLTTITYQRSHIWSSIPTLYSFMFEVNPGSMRLSAVKARLLAREGKYREAREILNHFDNPGADIQKLNITCLEKGSLDDKVMENVTTGLKKTIDMYTFDELRELSDSGMEGRCKYSRELLLSLFDRVLSMPTGHKFQAHKFYVVKARYLWMEGRAEEAYKSLEDAVRMISDDPVPLYIAAQWSAESGDIGTAEQYLDRAGKLYPYKSEQYSEFDRNIRQIIQDKKQK